MAKLANVTISVRIPANNYIRKCFCKPKKTNRTIRLTMVVWKRKEFTIFSLFFYCFLLESIHFSGLK